MAKVSLCASEQYWRLKREQPAILKKIVNGCGVGGWKGKLIPDTILLLSIKEACNIHDFDYHTGLTLEEKKLADRKFLNNMMRIIEAGGGPEFLKRWRRTRATEYYLAVKYVGGPAFWANKNKTEDLGDVDVTTLSMVPVGA